MKNSTNNNQNEQILQDALDLTSEAWFAKYPAGDYIQYQEIARKKGLQPLAEIRADYKNAPQFAEGDTHEAVICKIYHSEKEFSIGVNYWNPEDIAAGFRISKDQTRCEFIAKLYEEAPVADQPAGFFNLLKDYGVADDESKRIVQLYKDIRQNGGMVYISRLNACNVPTKTGTLNLYVVFEAERLSLENKIQINYDQRRQYPENTALEYEAEYLQQKYVYLTGSSFSPEIWNGKEQPAETPKKVIEYVKEVNNEIASLLSLGRESEAREKIRFLAFISKRFDFGGIVDFEDMQSAYLKSLQPEINLLLPSREKIDQIGYDAFKVNEYLDQLLVSDLQKEKIRRLFLAYLTDKTEANWLAFAEYCSGIALNPVKLD